MLSHPGNPLPSLR